MKSELIYIKVLLPFTSYRSKTRNFQINSAAAIRLMSNGARSSCARLKSFCSSPRYARTQLKQREIDG
jgi:hypothetical protein